MSEQSDKPQNNAEDRKAAIAAINRISDRLEGVRDDMADIRSRRRLTGHRLLIAAVVLVVIVVTIYVVYRPQPFNPLRFYPETVSNRISGYTGPAVHLGDPIKVTAVKCSTQAVTVVGSSNWTTVSPTGNVVTKTVNGLGHYPGPHRALAGGPKADAHGCITYHFTDLMTPAMEAVTRTLFSNGYGGVVWEIIGTETPQHGHAVAQNWETEPFLVVP